MSTSAHVRSIFSKARILGTGSDKIMLSESEIFTLLHKSVLDLNMSPNEIGLIDLGVQLPNPDYYKIPLPWFDSFNGTSPETSELLKSFDNAVSLTKDFALYFANLFALHKRRLKYQKILSCQPKPTMEQIGPRSLIEYGLCETPFLSSWMIWRKWIFDIDNRSGQETGYLFEPILASCIGGDSVGASNSPVKRINENGNSTNKGRQIDCYDGENNLAYEFKLRVTVAASGQGRFGEELSFPVECRAAGLKPVLIVLDPNRSNRLDALEQAFLDVDGEVYTGEDAWIHLDKKAGDVMSVFLELYIRPPLTNIAHFEPTYPAPLHLSWDEEKIEIKSGDYFYRMPRE